MSSNGFECTLDTTTKTLVIYGFDKFVGPGDIKIKIRMMNGASASGSWDYNSYYELETPFNKLITYGTGATPTLNNPTVI